MRDAERAQCGQPGPGAAGLPPGAGPDARQLFGVRGGLLVPVDPDGDVPGLSPRLPVRRPGLLLGLALIVFSTAVNAVGIKLLARINNLGVFSELLGVVLLIVLLALHVRRGPGVVFDTAGHGRGAPLGYFGPFCAAAIMASYVM